ncbi:MAG: phosphate ABC transporter permease subunit PstC [Spirochaetia bacterium]|nr:phosphate ABC transporter permease subunit PstC [Spirochaetota bacterium]MCX8096524.1 phosphate ABC transporter permease subunit PstC [Spirochaetota bacterium]MDW8112682.1 phosphate ABC transporter permease subunit PstC [Spirochaetia bacterium]
MRSVRKGFDIFSRLGIYFVAFLAILLLIFIIFFIFRESFLIISKGYINEYANLNNLFSSIWQPVSSQPKYGILPLIVGSLKVAIVALIIAIPLGVLSALYVTVYASRRIREFIKPVIELIAGLPTVVIGFFMLMVVASFLQEIFQWDYRLNAIVGGIGVSIAILPVIFTITEDGMNTIPHHLKESAYALGASKHHIAWKVILPSSINYTFSAIIVGGIRAFGETMIVLMATGNAAVLSFDFLLPLRSMAATIGSEMGEVAIGDEHYAVLFFIGSILLTVTVVFNILANYISARIKRKIGIS